MSSRDKENHGGSKIAVLETQESRVGLKAMVAVASLIVALVLMLGAMNTPAWAAEVSASQMKVSVWPEYDDPRVLVIYQGDLDPSVQLPVDVTFNIPKGAEIGMACEVDSGGGHACKPYQLVDKGDYQALTYKVEAQHKIFFEYYYDAFPAGVDARAFDFTYRPGFSAATTTIEVQEPRRSTAFTLDPALSQVTTDSEGLKYHLQDYSALPVDEPFTVKVAYSKTDANPSVQKASNDSAQPGQASAAGGGGNNNALFIVLAALAFGSLVFGGYRAFRPATATSNRGNRSSAHRPSRSRTPRGRGIDDGPQPRERSTSKTGPNSRTGRTSKRGGVDTDSKVKFCVSCGTQLRREDRFCSACGDDQS